jgi:hypothetical protein
VIGAYVPTHAIGPYLPATLEKAGKPFKPEESAYAGTENPVGKRFRGIVRWAMPVVKGGKITGYVTLALDHDHIRQFSDRLMPTEDRYTPIADAIKGNYAFIWDYKSRSISHPRDYFIVGYDPQTGLPATPWMDAELYAEWQAERQTIARIPRRHSGIPRPEPQAQAGQGTDQGRHRRPRLPLPEFLAAMRRLECRHRTRRLRLFRHLLLRLWKLTTAAAIPYYTGQYGKIAAGLRLRHHRRQRRRIPQGGDRNS